MSNAKAQTTPGFETPFSRTHARIFLVDDEPANILLLEHLLGAAGYTALVPIQDPRQVMDRYREERADLILLDINMPHMDGYEVMAQLRALNDPLLPPIVILTAETGRDVLVRALAEGARDFIRKPFDRVELRIRVMNLLDAQLAHHMLHDRKAVLEEMVQQRTEELRETRLQVVRRLGRAAEYRDSETGLHIIRMSKVSALLAASMGHGASHCEAILHASPMHDIGKIGIPDAILLKPGKLDAAEFAVMKTHAAIGADLLSGEGSELLQLASIIAASHHERWDGGGYPNQLKAEDIPQAGRIVAVADVFDALTSSRPYKRAWPVAEAVAYMKNNAGSHFDPAMIEHFLQCLPEIVAIGERHAEPKGQ